MANKIQIRRGLKAKLPVLSVGELALTTDTNEVYIGTNSGNKRVDGAGASDLSGYVPASRTINSKPLTANISLTAADVGAASTATATASANGLMSASDKQKLNNLPAQLSTVLSDPAANDNIWVDSSSAWLVPGYNKRNGYWRMLGIHNAGDSFGYIKL